MHQRLYAETDSIDFSIEDIPSRKNHQNVLFVEPSHFQILYRINPFMNWENIDRDVAQSQWKSLIRIYERYAESIDVLSPHDVWSKMGGTAQKEIPSPDHLPDMVFCANQSIPYPKEKRILISRMATRKRMFETEYLRYWFHNNGYETVNLETHATFEGMGDALWYPNREILFGGYGFRSEKNAYEELSERFDVPVILFELKSEKCYHLDICLSLLDEQTALVFPDGIVQRDMEKLRLLVNTLIEVPEYEAIKGFACNAHALDGEHVVIQEGNDKTITRLEDHGFSVTAIDTSEFMKAGGSVFCMKLMLP